MKEISSGKIDFSTLASIPAAERSNESVTALSVQEDINHKHLNFRTATIALKQNNTSLTEHTSAGANAQETIITFGNIKVKDGVMLQLFYLNRWYAVILGEPLQILHNLYSNDSLDPTDAYNSVQKARIAYPVDIRLSLYEKKWRDRYIYAREEQQIEKIRETYKFYQNDPKDFFVLQLEADISKFETDFPGSSFTGELLKIKKAIKKVEAASNPK